MRRDERTTQTTKGVNDVHGLPDGVFVRRGVAAYAVLAVLSVVTAVRSQWKQAGLVAVMVAGLWFLPVSATFWTVAGLVLLAVLVFALFLAFAGAACNAMGRGDVFGWYGAWNLAELMLKLLGVVLMALLDSLNNK